MSRKRPKGIELGTSRVAELMNVSDRRIRVMCAEGKFVAHQPFPGASWRIFMSDKEYEYLKSVNKIMTR